MLKIFSGTSNQNLSKKIADALPVNLAKSETVRFANSEVRVRIEEEVRDDTCVIIQSTDNPTDTNLMELFLMADALRREEAKKVIAMIPYFGYARQDIQHRAGECVSANVVIRFLEAIGIDKVYVFDLHDEATEGVFNIPFKNLSALPLLADKVKEYLIQSGNEATQNTVAITSPDQGGIERARKFGEHFFGTYKFDMAVTEKRRNLEHIHESQALALFGDVKDKTVILVDDVSTSGSTIINSANFCMENGAKAVLSAVVHSDFAADTPGKLQDSVVEKLFTTNTIDLKPEYRFEKMEIVDVSGVAAEVFG